MIILKSAFFKVCEKITTGRLVLTTPDGHTHTFGDISEGARPQAEIIINDWSVVMALFLRGDIGLGETYSEGKWDSPDIEKLVLLFLANENIAPRLDKGIIISRLTYVFKNRILYRNNRSGSRANIAAHYDVGNEFYQLWLDETMTYSSALYEGTNTLEKAQKKKYSRLLDLVSPALQGSNTSVLEVGCGWGGFAESAADKGCDVTAITISNAQHAFAQNRLGSRADIKLQDYRDTQGKFDAIVSIEMIEAVGLRYWPEYFGMLKARLAEGGTAAIQAIIIEDEYFETYKTQSDYIREYTFPGGMLISPAEIRKQAKKAGLVVDEFYRFGTDYARTLREWLTRLNDSEAAIRALGHDDSFLRSWRYYLQVCAGAFQEQVKTNVVQVQLRHRN